MTSCHAERIVVILTEDAAGEYNFSMRIAISGFNEICQTLA